MYVWTEVILKTLHSLEESTIFETFKVVWPIAHPSKCDNGIGTKVIEYSIVIRWKTTQNTDVVLITQTTYVNIYVYG